MVGKGWIVACLLVCQSVWAAPLTVLVGQHKPPYIKLDTVSGYEIELLREVVRRMGYEAEFTFLPNSRIRSQLERGFGDIASLQPNEPDEPGLFFSQPYIRYQNVVVARQSDELTLQHPADLALLTTVAFQGATMVLGADYRDAVALQQGYLETVDQQAQVEMLFSGRVKAIVLDRNIFTYHQQQSKRALPAVIHELFGSTLYRAAFRDPVLQRRFDQALLSVLLDNWYEQLQLKYLLQLNQELPNRFYCNDTPAVSTMQPAG